MACVDVIIPLYNKQGTILRTIESVRNQRFCDWRIIVVDDGSADNGPELVRSLNDSRIDIIVQENRGPGAARNAGIAAASAPYLAFLDADDQWYPWYLENAVRAIQSHNVSFVGTTYYEWPKQIDMAGYWARRGAREGVYELTGAEPAGLTGSLVLFFRVWNTVVLKEAACRCGCFYEKEKCCYGEDTVFFARLVFNEKFAIIGPPAVRHNKQDSGLTNVQTERVIPFLLEPKILLDYCLPDRSKLAELVIARLALRTAHHKARNGFKEQAAGLLRRFPKTREFGFLYFKCRLEIILSRYLPYWVRFKCFVGPKLRLFVRAWKINSRESEGNFNCERYKNHGGDTGV